MNKYGNSGFDIYICVNSTDYDVVYENCPFVPRIGEQVSFKYGDDYVSARVNDIEYRFEWEEVWVYVDLINN